MWLNLPSCPLPPLSLKCEVQLAFMVHSFLTSGYDVDNSYLGQQWSYPWYLQELPQCRTVKLHSSSDEPLCHWAWAKTLTWTWCHHSLSTRPPSPWPHTRMQKQMPNLMLCMHTQKQQQCACMHACQITLTWSQMTRVSSSLCSCMHATLTTTTSFYSHPRTGGTVCAPHHHHHHHHLQLQNVHADSKFMFVLCAWLGLWCFVCVDYREM